MIEPDYRHVLFKDLKPYLKRTDYLSGFTPTELAYIRKNIGAASIDAILVLIGNSIKVTHKELYNLIENSELVVGAIYIITDFQTIYEIHNFIDASKFITLGLDLYPSEVYNIVAIAISKNLLLSNVSIIRKNDPSSIFWSVQYDPIPQILSDGTFTKGRITYLSDNNFNQACYDFKNIVTVYMQKAYHTFSDLNGDDNSDNCFNNNLCFLDNSFFVGNCSNNCIRGNNVKFFVPVNNLTGELKNVCISVDEIGLSNETEKSTILYNNVYHIDYLDLETLTHQFYALSNNIYSAG